MSFVLQIAASGLAIGALAWMAHRMRLGGDDRIADEAQARALADEALHGFDATEIVIDRNGLGALCRNADGQVLLLRRHGSHWAARLLDTAARARRDGAVLTVDPGERTFGTVALDLGEVQPGWVTALASTRPAAGG